MRNKNKIITKQYNSPFGNLLLGSYNEHICLCDWLINNRKENVDLMLKRRLSANYIEAYFLINNNSCTPTKIVRGIKQSI